MPCVLTRLLADFLLLCIQSAVCCGCVFGVKKFGIISFPDFEMGIAKAWFPVSFLLVSVIYTGMSSTGAERSMHAQLVL
jgi:GDP-mannose transporter